METLENTTPSADNLEKGVSHFFSGASIDSIGKFKSLITQSPFTLSGIGYYKQPSSTKGAMPLSIGTVLSGAIEKQNIRMNTLSGSVEFSGVPLINIYKKGNDGVMYPTDTYVFYESPEAGGLFEVMPK